MMAAALVEPEVLQVSGTLSKGKPAPRGFTKITELEGVRGFLCWWVVISHLLLFSGVENQRKGSALISLLGKGSEAVDGFVILSGFVILLLLDKGRDSYGVFVFRRFFRLFPVYFLCLLGTVFLAPFAPEILAALPWGEGASIQRLITNWHCSTAHAVTHLGLHLTMLHGLVPQEILPNSAGAFLGPAWSISLEWQFYLIAPFIYCLIKGHARWVMAICGLVVAVTLARSAFGDYTTPGKFATWPLPAFLPIKARFFFVGALSFFAFKFITRSRDLMVVMSAATLAGLTLLAVFTKSMALMIWEVAFGAYLCRFSANENLLSRAVSSALNCPVSQWLGRISYSTYLCHAPLIYLGIVLLLRVPCHWTPGTFLGALSLLVVPATILCSQVLFQFIEKPFIEGARRWSSRKEPSVATV